ncbi:MAG: hypothetical protein ACLUW6_09095 [Coriobacteriaceae bacterium]
MADYDAAAAEANEELDKAEQNSPTPRRRSTTSSRRIGSSWTARRTSAW